MQQVQVQQVTRQSACISHGHHCWCMASSASRAGPGGVSTVASFGFIPPLSGPLHRKSRSDFTPSFRLWIPTVELTELHIYHVPVHVCSQMCFCIQQSCQIGSFLISHEKLILKRQASWVSCAEQPDASAESRCVLSKNAGLIGRQGMLWQLAIGRTSRG